jgi:hypothetical protein
MTRTHQKNLLKQGTVVRLKQEGSSSPIGRVVTPVAWYKLPEGEEVYRILYGPDEIVMLVKGCDVIVVEDPHV